MSVTWLNGAFVEGSIAIDPADRGFTLGDGVFETLAVRSGRVVWLEEHLSRMIAAARELGIAYDDEKIRKGVAAVLRRGSELQATLRITLTRGTVTPRALTGVGLQPTLAITLTSSTTQMPSSITLATTRIRRNETSPASRLKTLSYIDNIAAAREVTARADDALMLNTKGHVACTTIGNLFLVKGRTLVTPSLDQGILAGITRAKILNLAQHLNLEIAEREVLVPELYEADAVFRTNSLRLATPVTKVDDREIGLRSIEDINTFLRKGNEP
jgi:branched-chain amino acid aminotransferase